MASDFAFELDSKNLLNVLDGLKANAVQAAERALMLQAELVMTKAKLNTPVALRETYPHLSDAQFKERFTPGALRASGHVGNIITLGSDVFVELRFGNSSAPYALIVHEVTTAHHPVGEAKFLENAVNQSAAGMIDEIAHAWAEHL